MSGEEALSGLGSLSGVGYVLSLNIGRDHIKCIVILLTQGAMYFLV